LLCYQCEQTYRNTGCVDVGVCGKDETTAAQQDLLVERAKAVACQAHADRAEGKTTREADAWVLSALFATGTNVNFDKERLSALLKQAPSEGGESGAMPLRERLTALGADIAGLQELILYGVKGTAAYAEHTRRMGCEDDAIYAGLHEILAFLAQPSPSVDELLAMGMKTGELNLRVMELLDAAHTGTFGHPAPTSVRTEPLRGKAIVVSGHDLSDLAALLDQTVGKGINVYTHGEMLPAHGYPELKKHPHLAGNFGGAWMDQTREFDEFPGAILMTSNCLQPPRPGYLERLFTSGPVAWPEVAHISGRDFTPVIEAALAAPGLPRMDPDAALRWVSAARLCCRRPARSSMRSSRAKSADFS